MDKINLYILKKQSLKMNTKIIFISMLLTLCTTIQAASQTNVPMDRNGFPLIAKKTSPSLSFKIPEGPRPEPLNSSTLHKDTSFDLSTPQTTTHAQIDPKPSRKKNKRNFKSQAVQTMTILVASKATETDAFHLPDIHEPRRNRPSKQAEPITLQRFNDGISGVQLGNLHLEWRTESN